MSYPITSLPLELREMIYEYYLEGMDLACTQSHKPKYACYYDDEVEDWITWRCPRQTNSFQPLQPYLGMLHLSSGVRFETDTEIYEAAFTDVWFNLEIDSDTNDIKRMKDIFTQIRYINRDVKFGLHFTVSNHNRDTFLRFVDSFFNIHATEDNTAPAFVRCQKDRETQRLMRASNASDAKINYTYKSEGHDFHRLWMYDTLGRLDWSRFNFKVPPVLLTKRRLMDNSMNDPTRTSHRNTKARKAITDDVNEADHGEGDGIDIDLDSENEVIAFNSEDDDEAMHFDNGDEKFAHEDDDEEALHDGEEGGYFYDDVESERSLLVGEGE